MKFRKSRFTRCICVLALFVALHSTDAVEPVNAAFPGTNGKIAFQGNRDGNFEIYAMDPDGSNQTNLTNSPSEDFDPAWSPDGEKIAFSSKRDGDFEVYVMDADGSNLIKITDNTTDDIEPAWSPDGTKIAFVRGIFPDLEVYVMNADGTDAVRLTFNSVPEWVPDWSPGSTKIVFSSWRDFDYEIYVMDADGGSQTRLTYSPSDDLEPGWSPDGNKIAFTSYRTGGGVFSEIYVMNADGSAQTNLSNGDGRYAAWSPDGTKIAYSSWRSGGYWIHVMDSDGSNSIALTSSAGFDYWADWGPVPDSDGDGINDNMDVEGIQGALAEVPTNAFQGYPGQVVAITSVLDDTELLIAAGDREGAITKLLNLSRRVDGCGSEADRNDWIVDCAAQVQIRGLIDDLIASLSN